MVKEKWEEGTIPETPRNTMPDEMRAWIFIGFEVLAAYGSPRYRKRTTCPEKKNIY